MSHLPEKVERAKARLYVIATLAMNRGTEYEGYLNGGNAAKNAVNDVLDALHDERLLAGADGWQPIESRPEIDHQPGRQFIRVEGECEHSGLRWSRIGFGEAFIRKPGSDDEFLQYRKSDIVRICKDSDMALHSAKVTHWKPANFDFPAAPSPAGETCGDCRQLISGPRYHVGQTVYCASCGPTPATPHPNAAGDVVEQIERLLWNDRYGIFWSEAQAPNRVGIKGEVGLIKLQAQRIAASGLLSSRDAVLEEACAEIDRFIKKGPLKEPAHSERNGMVLAYNLVCALKSTPTKQGTE